MNFDDEFYLSTDIERIPTI